jgi:hypothetical protein
MDFPALEVIRLSGGTKEKGAMNAPFYDRRMAII